MFCKSTNLENEFLEHTDHLYFLTHDTDHFKLQYLERKPHQASCFSFESSNKLEFGEKLEYLEKNPWNKARTNNKLNSLYRAGIKPRSHWCHGKQVL